MDSSERPSHNLRDLEEVHEPISGEQSTPAEVKIDKNSKQDKARELQKKFNIILVFQGSVDPGKKIFDRSLVNLDQALTQIKEKYGNELFKGKLVYIEPIYYDKDHEKTLKKSGSITSFGVNWGDSVEEMIKGLENVIFYPTIVEDQKKLREKDNIKTKFYFQDDFDLTTFPNLKEAVISLRKKLGEEDFPIDQIEIVPDKQEIREKNKAGLEKPWFNPEYYIKWGDSVEQMKKDLEEVYNKLIPDEELDDTQDL